MHPSPYLSGEERGTRQIWVIEKFIIRQPPMGEKDDLGYPQVPGSISAENLSTYINVNMSQ